MSNANSSPCGPVLQSSPRSSGAYERLFWRTSNLRNSTEFNSSGLRFFFTMTWREDHNDIQLDSFFVGCKKTSFAWIFFASTFAFCMSTPSASVRDGDCIWYFTFGANMNANTLKSRGICPTKSIVGTLPGYRLVFNYKGYDFVEPSFANVEPITHTDNEREEGGNSHFTVEGVAHRILLSELFVLDSFEGEGTAYERFETLFRPTHLDPPSLHHTSIVSSLGGFLCCAYRAMPHMVTEQEDLPSVRYKHLLLKGARDAKLSREYQDYLNNTASFSSFGTLLPEKLISAIATENVKCVSLDAVKQNNFNQRDGIYEASTGDHGSSSKSLQTFWVTVGGWVFDVSSDIEHRAMLRKMSGIDGTIYCLTLWATSFGSGPEESMHPMVDMSQLHGAQQEYIACWLHHLVANFPLIGKCKFQEGEHQ